MATPQEKRSLQLARRFFGEDAEALLELARRRAGDRGILSVHGYLAGWNCMKIAATNGRQTSAKKWSKVLEDAYGATEPALPF